jgi:Protein of unknown function (DUF2752)
MTQVTHSGIATGLRAGLPPAAVGLTLAVLRLFSPAQYSFYPQCPIFEYLHLECPGCGTTRALAALLHGRLAEAFHFNALVILLLPVAAAYATLCYYRFLQRRPLRWPQTPPVATYFACVVAVLFTIVRNLPLHFF